MAAVKELLRAEEDGTLSFGDYTLADKTKLDGFEFQGDLYKVKTFSEITKLERNGMFVYESVPGTAVEKFLATRRRFHSRCQARRMLSLPWNWRRTASIRYTWMTLRWET